MPADPTDPAGNASTLWSRRGGPAPPEQAITTVHGFLERCRSWGTDREIPKLLARLSASATTSDAARLHQWTTWVAFLDHAIQELEDGTLDSWFGDPGAPSDAPPDVR